MTDGTPHIERNERRQSVTEFLTVGVLGLVVGAAVGWLGEGLVRGGAGRSDPPGLGNPAEPGAAPGEGEPRLEYGAWLARLEEMERRVVPEETFTYLALPPLDPEGRINEDVRDLFLLGDEEVERLNRIIEETEARLVEAELDHMEVLGMTDDEAVFLIPAFEEGAEIESSFHDSVIEVLGEKDGELLWPLLRRSGIGDDPGRWRDFGRGDREISFTVRETDPPVSASGFEDEEARTWLQYEERVPEEILWFPVDDNGWRVEVSRVAALLRDTDDAARRERFFDPDTERFGYLVPYLPEGLIEYLRE